MAIDAKLVMQLRNETSAGVNDCREALEKSEGDMAKAKAYLKEKGLAKGAKLADRAAKQGRVASYVHQADEGGKSGKGGALVELNCETDFVAKAPDFVELARMLAQIVYGFDPKYVTREQIPAPILEEETAKYADEVKGKPPDIAAKVLEAKLVKNLYSKLVLLDMPFGSDDSTTVGDVIKSKIGTMKENIVVGRFARFEIGV
ncbi:MAG: elongation factor Ts [Planctomycetota bacterium]